MGDFVFVVLVLGGLGVFFYRQNQAKQAQKAQPETQTVSCATRVEPVVEEAAPAEDAVTEETAQPEAAVDVEEPQAEDVVAAEEMIESAETSVDEDEDDDGEGETPSEEQYDALTWRVLQRVMEQPGIMQTEIYGLFPKENRKHLQATLLQLDKENVLRREKEGNSYRLFPV